MVYVDVFQCVELNNYTGSALSVWSCINQSIPIFSPFLLFSLFLIVLGGTYFSEVRLRGYGDLVGSFCIASIFIGILSMVMFMASPPIIDKVSALFCFVLGIIGVVAIFSSIGR